MKHKIQQVMKERDDSKPLTHFIQIDDAYWGGKKRDGVRGRGATGKIPFVAAVSTNKHGHPLEMRFSQVEDFTKKALHGTFHAISQKHFSRYLAEFCYRFNRRFDLEAMISRLGYVAVRTPPMPQRLFKVAEFHG